MHAHGPFETTGWLLFRRIECFFESRFGCVDMFQNKTTQKDVRTWFSENGYRGGSLSFQYLDLYAIKPPGWEQIYTFEVDVQKVDEERKRVYGVVFDDERITEVSEKFKVAICFDRDEHQKQLDEWSIGFIAQKPVRNR